MKFSCDVSQVIIHLIDICQPILNVVAFVLQMQCFMHVYVYTIVRVKDETVLCELNYQSHAENMLQCYVEKNVKMDTIIGLQLFTNTWCK